MADTNWLRQTPDKPLFPDLIWSRPENKNTRGKLLIIGGNSHAFSAVSGTYGAAGKAGIGTARVIVPDALQKNLGKIFPEAEFAPSTPSGSFARTALAPMLDMAGWADGVLLAGDFGNNSETALALESFIKKYAGPLTLTGDSIDYFVSNSESLLDRAETVLAAEFKQLQRLLAGKAVLRSSMDLAKLVDALGELAHGIKAGLVTLHGKQAVVAYNGRVSTTPFNEINLVNLAAHASVWQLQQAGKAFEALSSAAYCSI